MKVSKIAGIIAKARHYLKLKNLKELYYAMVCHTWPILTLTGQAHNQLDQDLFIYHKRK